MMKQLLIFLVLFLPVCLLAQFERNNDGRVILFGVDYGFQFPGGDLKDRFGNSTGLGLRVEYLTKNNYAVNLQYAFNFGSTVKEDPLADLRGNDGFLIGTNFTQANVLLRQRSFFMGGTIGKVFPLLKKNKRSGIKLEVGAGLFQHKIRVQEDPENFVPIIAGDYKKGYDRLSNGLALKQFLGYQHLSKNRLLNFYGGFEFTQAFTQNRRGYNYDTMSDDSEQRFDLLHGFKIGWILPFYISDTGDEIYY